jgi:hypothetical protein
MVHSFRLDKPQHGELTTCNVMWATIMYEDESRMIYAYWHDVIPFVVAHLSLDQICCSKGHWIQNSSFNVEYHKHKSRPITSSLTFSFGCFPDWDLALASLQILSLGSRLRIWAFVSYYTLWMLMKSWLGVPLLLKMQWVTTKMLIYKALLKPLNFQGTRFGSHAILGSLLHTNFVIIIFSFEFSCNIFKS